MHAHTADANHVCMRIMWALAGPRRAGGSTPRHADRRRVARGVRHDAQVLGVGDDVPMAQAIGVALSAALSDKLSLVMAELGRRLATLRPPRPPREEEVPSSCSSTMRTPPRASVMLLVLRSALSSLPLGNM